jgi:23S rRNA pseudouridine1911/1915/1917 synthase
MASIGHPVVGDTLYGAPKILLPNTLARERQGTAISSHTEAKKARSHGESKGTLSLPRNFLHAAQLNFTHPKSGKAVKFDAPLPEDLETFLEKLRRMAEKMES